MTAADSPTFEYIDSWIVFQLFKYLLFGFLEVPNIISIKLIDDPTRFSRSFSLSNLSNSKVTY